MAVASFLFIFMVSHLISFLKSTLTIPKIKDLVDSPSQKYKNIYDQLSNKSNNHNNNNNNNSNNSNNSNNDINSTNIDQLLPQKDGESAMKQDLKTFLKKQLNVNSADSTDVYSSDSTYSPYN